MSTSRRKLLELLARKSFRLGEFKLSSGGTSDYYIDCRTTTLDARGAQLSGQVFLEEIREQGWEPNAIGGLTMGADPIVVAVAVTSGTIHGFLVRKAEKQHGTGRRIEGFAEKGARVVIVDDVCTTGSSTIQAIQAAREFGFTVVGAACLVEREEAAGFSAVAEAASPAPFISAIVPSVRTKITARMTAGAAVHAISSLRLRSKVAGSPARCREARYRQIA